MVGVGLRGIRVRPRCPWWLELALSGVVVASINYRLAPRARHPSALIDIKRAIHFCRTHAAQLHVDPALIFLAGDSAGGHLAALAGLTVGRAEYQPGFEEADVGVLGVIDLYGIHSFMVGKRDEEGDGFLNFLSGYVMPASIDDRPDLYRDASPVHYLQEALKAGQGAEGERALVLLQPRGGRHTGASGGLAALLQSAAGGEAAGEG